MDNRASAILLLGFIIGMIFAAIAKADDSLIGLCSKTWDCGKTIEQFKERGIARFGYLAPPTFGEDCKCARRIYSLPMSKIVRIHLSNGPCLRNQRCEPREVFAGETIKSADRKIRRRDPDLMLRYYKWVIKSAVMLHGVNNLTCYVSPTLESDFSPRARRILLDETKDMFPQCQLVDNPLKGPCLDGYICERHGPNPRLKPPCIADLDGSEVNAEERSAYHARTNSCILSLNWKPSFNCLEKTFISPRKRDCGAVH